MSGNGWERFFNGHAPVYMNNPFTYNTVAEADFLLEELKPPAAGAILDIGCGTGRHSIELARRGYRMTGVDISSGMLAQAKTAAAEAGVKIDFIQRDASRFNTRKRFDAAICLCEGAFGLLGNDDHPIDHDLNILRSIHRALKPGTRLIMTVLNACAMVRNYSQKDMEEGRFDPAIMSEIHSNEPIVEGGTPLTGRERGYVPTELELLFRMSGFDTEHIWGGTAGNWSRRPVRLDEIEIMAVARRVP